MNFRRVFVISGGARGIGRVLVDRFAAMEQCAVSTCDIDFASSSSSLPNNDNNDTNTNVYRHQADVSQESDVKDFIQATVDRFGRIDCLINNAAIANPYLSYKDDSSSSSSSSGLEDVDMAEFQKVVQTNLVGPMLLAKYCTPHLRKAAVTNNKETTTKDGGGCIINISSTRAQMSEPHCEAYAASKGGIESLTHALAISLQKDKIRVNGVAPGWIQVDTEEYTPTAEDDAFHPVGRVGAGNDIFGVCEFLADSTRSGFITGQVITVDGGVTKKMIYPE